MFVVHLTHHRYLTGHFCICSISAQSNFAVGAVVNATFGSITELTFYITALLRGHKEANPCLQEVVKAALTGTLLGCILFIPVSQKQCFYVNVFLMAQHN